MGNLTIIPFTEMFERAARIIGDDALNAESKYKGFINDVYTKQLPRLYDWSCLKRSSQILCSAYYITGTVSISAGNTAVTGVGTVWTSGMTAANGWKIKFAGNDNIYSFTYASGTTATLGQALSGSTDIAGGSYILFRDTYSLASDFDRFLINGGLDYVRGGNIEVLMETSEDVWKSDFQMNPQIQPVRVRILGEEDSNGYKQIQLNPPPQTAIMLPYDYIKKLTPMTEYITGTISTLANGAAAVTGVGTAFTSYIQSGYTYYFRIDRDGTGDESVWYKISTAGGATSLTLASNYIGTSISGGAEAYTISMVPNLPSNFHDILLYLVVMLGVANQDNDMYQFYGQLATAGLNDLKTIFKTRTYNKEIRVNIDRR